ncbi:MAG: aspartate--tRNA ligase [Ruminococcaceae bacterium]|nr:aspartate--tRNA ligase [Oscillospiraceae bacterium]
MQEMRRTHYCLDLLKATPGDEVCVAGFIARFRDIGNLCFADLRDFTGIVQLAFDDSTSPELFEKAKSLKSEYVVVASGVLRERSNKNPNIPTGDLEIFVKSMSILSVAKTTPFEIRDEVSVKEELLLRYRYLDIRRPSLAKSLAMRHRITKVTRDFFDENRFIEIETPILINSTPEGARDYVVPSRVHKGRFFALPQSPQILKQLLIVGGVDRYFQIAKCFRDEDLRADRQPEFTQVDIEMAFCTPEDVMNLNERFIARLFHDVLDYNIELPLRRMTYKEAMERYGSDKPDTRFGLEINDITDISEGCGFAVFENAVADNGKVLLIYADDISEKVTRKEQDALTSLVKTYGAQGLAFAKITEDGQHGFLKFLSKEFRQTLFDRLNAKEGGAIFAVAGKSETSYTSLGSLRLEIQNRYFPAPESGFDVLWITEFPLFEFDAETNTYSAKHHPFTSPMDEDLPILETDPLKCRAKAYDMVINGNEVGGGSIRISNPEIQNRMFNALGLSKEQIREKFGFLLEAYEYGAPPHGGLAFGLDRLTMLMLNKKSIREVIAFPKVQSSADLMLKAPSKLADIQLEELGLQIMSNDGDEQTAN